MTAPLQNLFNYAYMHSQDPGTSVDDPQIQALIDQGILTKEEVSAPRTISGANGIENVAGDYMYGADPTRLPKSKYGDITTFRPSQFGDFKLKNPDLKYDDPNYGSITPLQNSLDPSSQKNLYDLIGPIFSAILTAGVGAPWWMTAGLGAAKSIGSDSYNALGLASSALPALGGVGVPSEVIQGLQVANTGKNIYDYLDNQGSGGGPSDVQAVAPGQPVFPASYNPSLFGDFGSMAAPDDGTGMVAGSVAPSAYNNSYESNGSSQLIS